MPRDHHPAAKSAAAARYLPMLADPLMPLAESVSHAVVIQIVGGGHVRSRSGGSRSGDAIVVGTLTETSLKQWVWQALEASISARTPQGKALRMALIAMLAAEESGGTAPGQIAEPPTLDPLLSTVEAAARLEVSRPYVSMLCDHGKLGDVVVTEGGHRRIRSSAVDAYLAARTQETAAAVSPRQAGLELGLYDRPDSDYVNVVRNGRPPARAKAAADKKAAARKSETAVKGAGAKKTGRR